jgi:hypothetical protein
MTLPFTIKINFIALYTFIQKYLLGKKEKIMCFKKWFSKPPEAPLFPSDKRALLFAINDYPGSGNDLNGCINDQEDMAKELMTNFPGFDIRSFKNSQVTRARFISEVSAAIAVLRSGDILLIHYSGHGTQVNDNQGDEEDGYDEAIYLWDGTVIDDDIGTELMSIPDGATVVLMFDSCFSGTVTRAYSKDFAQPRINRYVQNPRLTHQKKKIVRFIPSEMKWIVLSGCGEQQTSADAYFNDKPNGAFTYFALHCLRAGMTYAQWMYNIHKFLPSQMFNQAPTIEGRSSLFTKIVFTN